MRHILKTAKSWVWLNAKENSLLGAANSRDEGHLFGMLCKIFPYFQNLGGTWALEEKNCLKHFVFSVSVWRKFCGLQIFLIICYIPIACQVASSCHFPVCFLSHQLYLSQRTGLWENTGIYFHWNVLSLWLVVLKQSSILESTREFSKDSRPVWMWKCPGVSYQQLE